MVQYRNYLDQKLKNFENRIKYNTEIIGYLKVNKKLNNHEYNLVCVITTPSNDLYTGIIIDVNENVGGLKKNLSYYYDSRSNNHKIIEIKNLE